MNGLQSAVFLPVVFIAHFFAVVSIDSAQCSAVQCCAFSRPKPKCSAVQCCAFSRPKPKPLLCSVVNQFSSQLIHQQLQAVCSAQLAFFFSSFFIFFFTKCR